MNKSRNKREGKYIGFLDHKVIGYDMVNANFKFYPHKKHCRGILSKYVGARMQLIQMIQISKKFNCNTFTSVENSQNNTVH